MDPAQKHSSRIISPTNSAVLENQHSGLQQRGMRSYGCNAADGAGSGNWRGGEMVLTLAIVDLAHAGYHVRGENAHDGATGAGFRHWECLEGGRRGSGDYDEGTVGLRDGLTGHGCLDWCSEVGTGVPMLGGVATRVPSWN